MICNESVKKTAGIWEYLCSMFALSEIGRILHMNCSLCQLAKVNGVKVWESQGLALYPIIKSIVFNSKDNFKLNPFNFMANDHKIISK